MVLPPPFLLGYGHLVVESWGGSSPWEFSDPSTSLPCMMPLVSLVGQAPYYHLPPPHTFTHMLLPWTHWKPLILSWYLGVDSNVSTKLHADVPLPWSWTPLEYRPLRRGHSTAIQAGGAGKDCLSSGPRPWSPFSTMLFPTSLPAFAPAHAQSPHTQGLGPF